MLVENFAGRIAPAPAIGRPDEEIIGFFERRAPFAVNVGGGRQDHLAAVLFSRLEDVSGAIVVYSQSRKSIAIARDFSGRQVEDYRYVAGRFMKSGGITNIFMMK